MMKKSSVSRMQRFVYSQILPWKDELESTIKYCLGTAVGLVPKVHHNTELWTQLMVSQWNFSGIFPRIHHIAALLHSPRVTVKIERNTRIFLIDGSSSCRMFNDISWGSKDNEQECESSAKLVSIYARRYSPG